VPREQGAIMNVASLQIWRVALHAAIDTLFDVLERGTARKSTSGVEKSG
jgi:hypothetical protein